MKQSASQSNAANIEAGEYNPQNDLMSGDIDSQEEETAVDAEDVAKSLDDYNIMEITIDSRLGGGLAVDLNKSDRFRLVSVQKMVTRDGKAYQTTVYVLPEEAAAGSKEFKENDEKTLTHRGKVSI